LFQGVLNSVIDCTLIAEATLLVDTVNEGGRCDDSSKSRAFSSPLFITPHHIVSEYIVNAMDSVRLVELEDVLGFLEFQV
jgi:hypothetical protein